MFWTKETLADLSENPITPDGDAAITQVTADDHESGRLTDVKMSHLGMGRKDR